VDHRADIYSLGVVLYEMLTGDLPLGKFPPPSRKVQVDVRFDEVVLRALENDPERRYQRASDVKTEVETQALSRTAARGDCPNPERPGTGRRSTSLLASRAGIVNRWFPNEHLFSRRGRRPIAAARLQTSARMNFVPASDTVTSPTRRNVWVFFNADRE